MFYSHELLTSRKYGVATVWLVATLGSKSGLRRVTRKAIQGVDIEKACATVSDAQGQPLALRLQSNLLYGISRVYFQQCEYVLVDTQHAHNSLRTLWRHVVESQGLDPNAGRAKPENLIIPDDPGFLPDDIIPDPVIDLSFFESSVVSSSIPSILSGAGQASSGSNASVIGIELPSSVSGAVHDNPPLPFPDGLSHIGIDLEEDEGFNPNIGFGFDEDGNLFDFPPVVQDVELPVRSRSDSQANTRARLAFEADLPGEQAPQDVDISLGADDYVQVLPEAEPFPAAQSEPGFEDVAPRNKRTRRPIPMDKALQLRHSELADMNENYVDHMAAAKKQKIPAKNVRQARKNAYHYVLGRGLGDTGLLYGGLDGPLARFSGATLYKTLTGHDLNASRSTSKKRGIDPEGEASINKRARPEVGRGQEDDGGDMLPLFDDSVELGREAPPLPLYDEHSSQMPWNQPPSSRGTSRQGSVLRSAAGSARHPRSLDRASATRRLIPSSPLHGRGGGRVSAFLEGAGGDFGGGRDESGDDIIAPMSGPDASPDGGFDVHSPTLASQSMNMPWGATLDADAKRFLSFVCANADAVVPDAARPDANEVVKATTFDALLPHAMHTRLVAVQAFVHLLTLANEGCIIAKQDTADGIWVGVKKGYEVFQPVEGGASEALEGADLDEEMGEALTGAGEPEEADEGGDDENGTEDAERIARLRF